MTRVLTIRTDHEDMAAAVRALAPQLSGGVLRLTAPDSIEVGSWVRFRWLLRDGTMFWEGVGRSASCRPSAASGERGARFTLELSELSFDARNEAMYERIQLGADEGRPTGPVPRIPAKGPAPLKRYSSAPPPPRRVLPPAPPPAKLSSVVKAALRPKPGAPAPRAASKPSSIAAPAELAERARTLSRRLNLAAPSLARGRWTEERVLEAALRMGIEALEGLIDSRDAGDQ